MSVFKEKISKKIRESAYDIYQKSKAKGIELTVEDIYKKMNKNTFGKSGMNIEGLCERGGISKSEINKAILEGIKAPSIDSLA